MLRNYIKIAFRNLTRNKVYSLINILGLSLGLTCCLLLALYIQDEFSYDKHQSRLEDLYRITSSFQSDRGLDRLASTSPPIAPAMQTEVPEIEVAARVFNPPGLAQSLIQYEDKQFYESNGLVADPTIFQLFSYQWVEGNPDKALNDINSVVLSETLSRKLFGDESALNKLIRVSQGPTAIDGKVTGVFRESGRSHLQANFFVSMNSEGWGAYITKDPEAAQEWAGQNFVPAYVRLAPGQSRAQVVEKMNKVLLSHGAEDMKAIGLHKTLDLEPVRDIHLYSDINQSPRISYLYVMASIAVFILLIACINFMNLSTAKATRRAAEIGIRKAMGAFRQSLAAQILGEAMVIVMISILISLVILQAALPFFNQITEKQLALESGNLAYLAFALVGITMVTGLLAGSYPAFYLSSFEPAQVLKGKVTQTGSGSLLRRGLVVFQFMIAIALTCGMLVITRQMDYMQKQNPGFEASAKLILPLRTREARAKTLALKQELSRLSGISEFSAADYVPGSKIWNDMMFYAPGSDMEHALLHERNRVSSGYLELLGIPLIAGRSFTDNVAMDGNRKIIINRTSATKFGMAPEEIVGQQLAFDWQGQTYHFEVIGVMEDYHQQSLKYGISPMTFELTPDSVGFDYLIAKVPQEEVAAVVASIEPIWKTLIPGTPFEYTFLEDNIRKQYEDDQRVASVITTFTLLAMLISCLGLYGLSSYMTERRFKEIGVRKVLGATVPQILRLMSVEFAWLVGIAMVVAVPLSWFAMDRWLEGFAYRTTLSPLIFILACLAALAIALLTVSFESFRAARTNPAHSLRNE